MIVISGYLNSKESVTLRRIFKQHDDENSTAFAFGSKAVTCYFLNENSDAMLLLSRLFMKFGGRIHAYYIATPIIGAHIPRKYYDYVNNETNGKGSLPPNFMRNTLKRERWLRERTREEEVELIRVRK